MKRSALLKSLSEYIHTHRRNTELTTSDMMGEEVLKIVQEAQGLAYPFDPEDEVLHAAELAEELACSLKELRELEKSDDRDQLNCGLHMMSVYEKLMKAVESQMHPAYRKNIEQFRKENLVIPDESLLQYIGKSE
jgi:hypothetical protein